MSKRYKPKTIVLACSCVVGCSVAMSRRTEVWCYVHAGVFVVTEVRDTRPEPDADTACATLF